MVYKKLPSYKDVGLLKVKEWKNIQHASTDQYKVKGTHQNQTKETSAKILSRIRRVIAY